MPPTWIFTGLLLLALLPEGSYAQEAETQTVSMWVVFQDGIEWPGYLILLGSLAAIALIIDHFITIRQRQIAPPEQVRRARQLIERRKFRECLDSMRKSGTFFATTLAAALRHGRHGFEAMQSAAGEKAQELAGNHFRRVEYLNILGNLGPLLGLLGTVYGMIIAFAALAADGGEASADSGKLAKGISLALINTLLGLGLAIIGLGFYGWCRARVDQMTVAASAHVFDLLEYFRPASSLETSPFSRPTATPPASPTRTERP